VPGTAGAGTASTSQHLQAIAMQPGCAQQECWRKPPPGVSHHKTAASGTYAVRLLWWVRGGGHVCRVLYSTPYMGCARELPKSTYGHAVLRQPGAGAVLPHVHCSGSALASMLCRVGHHGGCSVQHVQHC
jgi:hypothetical protein